MDTNINKNISRSGHPQDTWYILVADDDIEVHDVTRLSLHNVRLLGRRIKLLHAMSAAEAVDVLRENHEIAVILLDVVMESPDAGLQLVQTIRGQLQMPEIRIILRTGQPGYAPEEKVIHEYDINDYKTKQELTHTHLITSIVACLRSYQQLRTINQNRAGLHKIISASSNLLEQTSVQAFADGVITQIASLLGLSAEGLLCASVPDRPGLTNTQPDPNPGPLILGAAGSYADLNQQPLSQLEDSHRRSVIRRCLEEKQHLYLPDETVLYIGREPHAAAIYMQTSRPVDLLDRELIELFLHNIAVAYQNVTLVQQLKSAAFADPLTGLANRNEFIRQAEDCCAPDDEDKAIALMDIRQFCEINDGLGQDVGDALLCAVANRLKERFADSAVIARVDADVFGLIADQTVLDPQAVLSVFDQPFICNDQLLRVSATLGTGLLKQMGRSGITRLKQAYIALNTAKRTVPGGYAWYVPELEAETGRRVIISRALHEALERQQLQVWYQPQFDLRSREVTGVEALLRWPQTDGSFISPAEFIPIAESSGLIVEIGSVVIEQVCQDLAALAKEGFADLRAAVNISMQQFRSQNFISDMVNTISKAGIRAGQIELEITESILMYEPDVVITALLRLKELGVTISIDDFGTGFSSLSYLRQLPLDRMKIDRSFVRDIEQPGGHVILQSILGLGQQLGLRTIAEGIETPEQEQLVKQLGCDEGQGFLYAQAMSLAELRRFVSRRQ